MDGSINYTVKTELGMQFQALSAYLAPVFLGHVIRIWKFDY